MLICVFAYNKIYNPQSTQLYDGLTISQALLNSSEIETQVNSITQNDTTQLEKAVAIYEWMIHNVKYDYSQQDHLESDANAVAYNSVQTYENKEGVCLGIASLYAVMAKDAGLKVSLIGGQGFGGSGEWVGHAWDRVYVEQGDYSVDATFQMMTPYNNAKFNKYHKDSYIIKTI